MDAPRDRYAGDYLDAFAGRAGDAIAWLTLLMAAVTAGVALLRYAFGLNAIVLQESVIYLHGLTLAFGIAYALKNGKHVRVDVFYARMRPRQRALVDLAGHLLLLFPVAALLFWSSLHYVAAAWRVLESSPEVGGIPAVFLLKTLIPALAALLFLQGIAESIKRIRELKAAARSVPNARARVAEFIKRIREPKR